MAGDLPKQMLNVQQVTDNNRVAGLEQLNKLLKDVNTTAAHTHYALQRVNDTMHEFIPLFWNRYKLAVRRVSHALEGYRDMVLSHQHGLEGGIEAVIARLEQLFEQSAKPPHLPQGLNESKSFGDVGVSIQVSNSSIGQLISNSSINQLSRAAGLSVNSTLLGAIKQFAKLSGNITALAGLEANMDRAINDTVSEARLGILEADRILQQVQGLLVRSNTLQAIASLHQNIDDEVGALMLNASDLVNQLGVRTRPVLAAIQTTRKTVDETSGAVKVCLSTAQNFLLMVPPQVCSIFDEIRDYWRHYILVIFIAVIIVALLVCGFGLYLALAWSSDDAAFRHSFHPLASGSSSDEDSKKPNGDEVYVVGLCAFHPRVWELDDGPEGDILKPLKRCCLRIRHLLRYHPGLSVIYIVLSIAAIMACMANMFLIVVSTGVDMLIDEASYRICQPGLFTSRSICEQAFTLLESITQAKLMDDETCTDRVMLVCMQNHLHMLLVATFVSTLFSLLLVPSQWYLVGHQIEKKFMRILDTIMCMGQ
jgi:hypothetical protein